MFFKGSYGKVFAATSKTGKKVAIKEVPNVFESRIQALRLLREIRILRYLQKEVSTTPHQCIVGMCERPFLFTETMHHLYHALRFFGFA